LSYRAVFSFGVVEQEGIEPSAGGCEDPNRTIPAPTTYEGAPFLRRSTLCFLRFFEAIQSPSKPANALVPFQGRTQTADYYLSAAPVSFFSNCIGYFRNVHRVPFFSKDHFSNAPQRKGIQIRGLYRTVGRNLRNTCVFNGLIAVNRRKNLLGKGNKALNVLHSFFHVLKFLAGHFQRVFKIVASCHLCLLVRSAYFGVAKNIRIFTHRVKVFLQTDRSLRSTLQHLPTT